MKLKKDGMAMSIAVHKMSQFLHDKKVECVDYEELTELVYKVMYNAYVDGHTDVVAKIQNLHFACGLETYYID